MRTRLFAPFLAAACLLLTISACASGPTNQPTTSQPAPTDSAILSGAPSSSATASPTTTPSATIAPTASVPTPHSTLASAAAFVWVSNASGSGSASGPYSYNSAGGAINVTHSAVGQYLIAFGGLASPGGVAHAQAYGGTPNYCAINSWYGVGADQQISVSCYDPTGNYADTRFVANWAAGSQGSAHFAYLWADQQSATAAYHPAVSYRYDSINSANLTVKRQSTGRYEVVLPAAGPELTDPWGFQISAYGSRDLCKLQSFSPATKKAVVACRTPNGLNVDTKFSLTFFSEASLIGRGDRRFGESGTGYSGVANPSIGTYDTTFNGMGQAQGQVVGLATGAGSTYCHVSNWSPTGADLTARIVCFNPGGAPATSDFLAAASW